MTNNEIKYLKSKIAPTNLSFSKNYYKIGNRFNKIITITKFPAFLVAGLLANIVSDQSIKVDMLIEPSRFDVQSIINKEVKNLNEQIQKSKAVETDEIRKKYEIYENYISELNNRNDKNFNVLLNITISAYDLDELKEVEKRLNSKLRNTLHFSTSALEFIQDDIYYKSSVFYPANRLENEINNTLGSIMTSQSVAALYPFIHDKLNDPRGLLFAYESSSYGQVLFDQFIYKNNPDIAKQENRLNGNLVVVGKSGSGKTTALNLLMMIHMLNTRKIVWVDPENKIKTLINRANGSYFALGTKNAKINVFDLKPISSDDDNDIDMWNTKIAIDNVIEDIKIILKYLDKDIDVEVLNKLGRLVYLTYNSVGIDDETEFRYLKPSDYPTFTNLVVIIENELRKFEEDETKQYVNDIDYKLLKKLHNAINPLTVEYATYFDGHTNINYENSNHFIGFGVKVFFQIRDELKTALMHIIIKYAWSLCLDQSVYSCLCLDESHQFIKLGETASQIEQFARRSRKYNNCLITATQESSDYANEFTLSSGQAIFNNSSYKLIMQLERNGIIDLNKLMYLTDSESALISRLGQGQGILIAGDKRMTINVAPTKAMLELME